MKKDGHDIRRLYALFLMLIAAVGFTVLGTGRGFAFGPTLMMRIDLEKNVFAPGERLAGKMIIESRIPAVFPAVFSIQMYKNGDRVRKVLLKTAVFSGKNEFDLENFSMMTIPDGPQAVCEWRIFMSYPDNPPVECEAQFSVTDGP